MASKVVNEPRIKNPLIKAIRELLEHRALWLYLLTDEEISNLCDWAMCGDRGIGEAYGCELDLPKTIARGDDVCHLIYHR